ncbi:TPA: MFS transporter [Elizabethkingia anophelis]|uniref:MFS transporter n=1 Tax=Elizabethkingia anophelis R26 TaxID=1246994 RepID=A0ABN5BSP4_9FLAO|nr:MFS transporter [Elizabethkingia anophelis]ATC37149.1 MFS transporter [Elizabethkingia anophelis R26]ATC40827.1 MFS transporter [Elizabethkingia anophelis Ag1]ATC44506.1 MFS transporter [Elizabethkingia anophelis]ATC48182.1 MFS transporter [Elizabethkingia anophelis]ELR79171.1 major facilitator superfamily protein [Elizabethkingia anophelis R26]
MKSFRNIGVLLLLSMSIFLAVIDLFVVNVAVPSIKESLNGTNSGAMFIIVAYVMGYASFLITGSIAGNRWGKKKVYAWGMLLFTVFSLFCSIAQNTFQLNIFRFFQGVSAAFMVPQGVGMIPYVFPDFKDRTKAFGIYGSIAGAASVIGQFLGGLLPELNICGIEGWRLIFIINIPLGGTAFVLSILKLKELPVIKQKSFDIFGLLLLTAFLITLIYPLIVGGESHWPFWSIAMLIFSLLLLFIFYLYEKYRLAKLNPVLIDVNLFSLKEFNIGILAAVFYYIAQDSYFFLNAIYLQSHLNLSSVHVGNMFVLQGIGYFMASLFSVRFVIKYDYKVMLGGSCIMILALVLHICYFTNEHINNILIYFILFLYGIGCGTMLPSMMTMALRKISSNLTASASGVYLTVQQISIALGVSIIGGIFFHLLGQNGDLLKATVAYHYSTYANILALVIVGGIFLFLSSRRNNAKE